MRPASRSSSIASQIERTVGLQGQSDAHERVVSERRSGQERDDREDEDYETPEHIGHRFEKLRRSAIFHLTDLKRLRSRGRAEHHYSDQASEAGALTNVNFANSEDAAYEVARDLLSNDLHWMLDILERMQYSEWRYRSFPYAPTCLLYVCGFGLGEHLTRNINERLSPLLRVVAQNMQLSRVTGDQEVHRRHVSASEVVWRATENARSASTRLDILHWVMLFGLGVSGIWIIWRSVIFGTILWCKHSLEILIQKVKRNDFGEEDYNSLEGIKWSLLWWRNIML